jgi:hypothetical protein
LFPGSSFGWPWRSNIAEDADEPSVVEDKEKVDEAMEFAYEDVDEAETWSPEDLGVGEGRPCGRASTENRTGSSFRWSNNWRAGASRLWAFDAPPWLLRGTYELLAASDIDSGSAVRFMGIGSVSGLNNLELWCLDEGGVGEEDILRRREKSSGSASTAGRETPWCTAGWDLRGDAGEGREVEADPGGFGDFSGREDDGDSCTGGIRSDFSLGRVALGCFTDS